MDTNFKLVFNSFKIRNHFKDPIPNDLKPFLVYKFTYASCSVSVDVNNMRLVILFDMLLNPSFKMMTSFANIARLFWQNLSSF